MAIVWWGAWLVVCGWRGGPGMLGFATVVMLIFGGWDPRPLFVARPLSIVERGRPGGTVAQATNRGVAVREPGRLGPPRQPHGSVKRRCQRELVSLRRVVVFCFGGSGAACVRGSPAGRDAGGTGSG